MQFQICLKIARGNVLLARTEITKQEENDSSLIVAYKVYMSLLYTK